MNDERNQVELSLPASGKGQSLVRANSLVARGLDLLDSLPSPAMQRLSADGPTTFDEEHILLVVEILRNYAADEIYDFDDVVRQFFDDVVRQCRDDFGKDARKLDPLFEAAWKHLTGENRRVSEILGYVAAI